MIDSTLLLVVFRCKPEPEIAECFPGIRISNIIRHYPKFSLSNGINTDRWRNVLCPGYINKISGLHHPSKIIHRLATFQKGINFSQQLRFAQLHLLHPDGIMHIHPKHIPAKKGRHAVGGNFSACHFGPVASQSKKMPLVAPLLLPVHSNQIITERSKNFFLFFANDSITL